jgi:sigma-B regulation protein RsbU (phosphoserine phosphatase)
MQFASFFIFFPPFFLSPLRMFWSSLRSKIFFLIVAILLVVAAVVMLVSRRDVTRTVSASEQHAVQNAMDLVLHDTEARWAALLNDKITTVRSGRRQLLQAGVTLESVLASYADMAAHGIVTTDAAKDMARAWIDGLRLDQQRYAFLYDASGRVLASGEAAMRGQDLSGLADFKGRPLARALYEESHTSGHGFAIYRWPVAAGGVQTRYAYFGYFRAWDWVIAVTDSVQDITEQIDTRRAQMKLAMRETLSPLTLARSGFLFIAADDGSLVVPPHGAGAGMLDATDLVTGRTLRQTLRQVTATSDPDTMSFDAGAGPWHIEALRFQPLGWTLAAAVPESDFTAPSAELLHRQAMIFAATLLLALLVVWLVAARIVSPLAKLTRYARELPRQDLTADFVVPAHIAVLPQRHRDEVGRLADSFLFMDRKLRENVARLMQETTARERFESELNIARAIQLGLLPVPLARKILSQADLSAVMLPAKEVGGDLYDYFVLPDGRLCVAIGDVSDKGVPAALFMAVTRTLIRATAEDESDPALMLYRINNRLAENNPKVMFVTLLLGVLDLETGELAWASAGHLPPAILSPNGSMRLLEGRSGPACGVMEDMPYVCLHARIEPGEILVGYTDGITEATNNTGGQYGVPRMLDILAQPAVSSLSITRRLLEDVQAFAAGTEQSDDITLIVIRRP